MVNLKGCLSIRVSECLSVCVSECLTDGGSVSVTSSWRRADARRVATYPEIAALLANHLPMLHHEDGTLVDGVVRLVPEPVLITLDAGRGGGGGGCGEGETRGRKR